MFCRNCGQVIADDASSCPNCGQSVSAPKQTTATTPVTGSSTFPVQQPSVPPATGPIYQQIPNPNLRKKKSHGCLLALLVILVLLIGGGAAVYFLIPGLARPVNLGVASSPQAYASVLKKMNYAEGQAPKTGLRNDYQAVYGALVPVAVSLSSEEVTAYLSYNRPSFAQWTNVQVKVGAKSGLRSTGDQTAYLSSSPVTVAADTPIEVSATVDRDYILNELLVGQYSLDEIQEALKSIGISNLIPAKVNLYLKMSGAIQNNQVVNLKLYAASVMGIAIPGEYVTSQDANSILSSVFNQIIADYNASSGAIFVSVRAVNGQILMEGQLPSSLQWNPAK